MGTLRTIKTDQDYKKAIESGLLDKECNLCAKSTIKDFKLWRIVQNSFPYDLIADVHHMLIPKRHCAEDELIAEEIEEMQKIKKVYLQTEYEWLLESTNKKKSIPEHFHLHMIIASDSKY